MAELMFIPLFVAFALAILNTNSSCSEVFRNNICNKNNKNNCFKPLNNFQNGDKKQILNCLSNNNNNYYLEKSHVKVYVTGKPESMTPSDAMNHAIRECTEKGVSGVGFINNSVYYTCV